MDWGVRGGMNLSPTAAIATPVYTAVATVVNPLNVIFEASLSFFSSTGGEVFTGVGATVHGIKLGSSATFAGGGGEVGGGVGFAIKTGIGAGLGAGAGFGADAGGGEALTIGFGAGAADALFILRIDPPTIADETRIARIKYLRFPFKVIPNDYGQKYFFRPREVRWAISLKPQSYINLDSH